MPVTDRLAGAAPPGSATPPAASLVDALQDLYRAYQKTSIYPDGHPAVPKALARAISGVTSLLENQEELVIEVSRRGLSVDGEAWTEATAGLDALASLLYDLEIAALEFRRGLTLQELESFTQELGRAKREGIKGATLIESMERLRIEGVRLQAIDYTALEFVDGSRILADPEGAAAQISERVRRQEGTGVGPLKKQVQQLSRSSRELSPERRKEVRKRISDFVSSLSPKLRRDLLCIDPTRPEESVEFVGAIAPDLSESDLLRALRELDHMGARVPGQMLTLLNKLVRISRTQPSVAADLERRLKDWGIAPEALSGAPGDLQEALQEVLQRRERADFYIPQPHKVLLSNLSRNHISTADFRFDDRYRDPRDMYDVRLHATQIAVRVVAGRGGERHRAGIFAYLATVTDALVERGRFDLVHDSAVAARTYSLLAREREETRRAAKGFLRDFATARLVRKILEHGCVDGGFSKDAVSLLVLGGETAIDQVVEFLDLRPPVRVAEVLKDFVATRSVDEMTAVLDRRLAQGWNGLKPILPLLGLLPPAQALPLLESSLSHEEFRVRRQAYAALLECGADESVLEPHLRRALEDESPRVSAVAMRWLFRWQGEMATELLGEVVEGCLAGETRRKDTVRRAARSLLLRGDAGVERLCRALHRLSRSARPRRVRLARIAVDTLRALENEPRVTRCLRYWKLSPSGCASRILPRERTGGSRGAR